PNTSFLVVVNGTAPGSGFSQLQAVGNVDLPGATLNVQLNFTPALGDQFAIVQSAGQIVGTFNGLPDQDVFQINGLAFKISYVNGTPAPGAKGQRLAASSQVILTRVADDTTGTELAASTRVAVIGQAVTFTATVHALAAVAGSVTFLDGVGALATVPLV